MLLYIILYYILCTVSPLGRGKLGDEHADTLIAVNNLVLLLMAQARLPEAEQLLRETLQGCQGAQRHVEAYRIMKVHLSYCLEEKDISMSVYIISRNISI